MTNKMFLDLRMVTRLTPVTCTSPFWYFQFLRSEGKQQYLLKSKFGHNLASLLFTTALLGLAD